MEREINTKQLINKQLRIITITNQTNIKQGITINLECINCKAIAYN